LLKFIYDLHKLEHVVLNAEEYKKIKEYKRIVNLDDPDINDNLLERNFSLRDVETHGLRNNNR
jgi:hypothetical protein